MTATRDDYIKWLETYATPVTEVVYYEGDGKLPLSVNETAVRPMLAFVTYKDGAISFPYSDIEYKQAKEVEEIKMASTGLKARVLSADIRDNNINIVFSPIDTSIPFNSAGSDRILRGEVFIIK